MTLHGSSASPPSHSGLTLVFFFFLFWPPVFIPRVGRTARETHRLRWREEPVFGERRPFAWIRAFVSEIRRRLPVRTSS